MDDSDGIHKLAGPLLILAAPGTGKTTTLAKRIKFLVEEEEVDPNSISVITFTAAAARQMREKVSNDGNVELYIHPDKQPERICTMHSLGNRIVKERLRQVKLHKKYRVVNSESLLDILYGDAAQLAGHDRKQGEITKDCRRQGHCKRSEEMKCEICDKYRTILRSCSAIDHDDQILLACELLKADSVLLKKYREYCNHLLVDEYQDINAGQFELIRLLSSRQSQGLFVVGDDDQSIYSFRGGSPRFIREFETHFGSAATVKPLSNSYRCHFHILEGAMSVVRASDGDRLEKGPFQYKNTAGPKVTIHNVPSEKREAKIVCAIAKKALYSGVLILVPTKAFLEPITAELRKSAVPYMARAMLPGKGLPLISSLLRWLANEGDSLSFRECLQAFLDSPQSGIPSARSIKTEKRKQREDAMSLISSLWEQHAGRKKDSLWGVLQAATGTHELYTEVHSAFETLRSLWTDDKDPAVFIGEVIRKLAPWKKTNHLMREVDSWVQFFSQSDISSSGPAVRLMTIHNAKGLEANVVCIVGLEEGILPRADLSEDQLLEQSRLMYVSMTRAAKELHLFHARKRPSSQLQWSAMKDGKPDIRPSEFLSKISDQHCTQSYHQAG